MKSQKGFLSCLVLLLVAASNAQQRGTAVEEFRAIQSDLKNSHASGDWQSNLTTANRLKLFLNGSPRSLLEVARADTRVDKLDAAFTELEQFAALGQSTELLTTLADFAPLRDKPAFAAIQAAMKENRTTISVASKAFDIPDQTLLAEDLDYDPNTRRFLITSVREKRIIWTDKSGAAGEFAKAPDNWPMLAIKIDRVRSLVWATEVGLKGFSYVQQSDWGRSALVCYGLKTGKLLRRLEGPHGSALGDMALSANGDVIVSDGEGGGIYRAAAGANALERLDSGDFISPQTLAMHPDHRHVFVPDYVRGIGILDTVTKQVQWISTEGRHALDGIDGLYFDSGKLIAVQNGTSPERVVAFALDASLSKITSEKIIERSTGTLGDPTHGVIVDGNFYYIANSGWDVTDDHGDVMAGAKTSAPRVMTARLASL